MADDPNEWMDEKSPEAVEIRYLVENTDLSPKQAKALVAEHGTDRKKLLKIAATIKAEG